MPFSGIRCGRSVRPPFLTKPLTIRREGLYRSFYMTSKERILDAASRLMWTDGYHATGVKAILEDAGATSGSFYHFFESKDDLLVQLLRRYRDLLEPMIFEPARRSSSDPLERVFAVLDVYRHHLGRNQCRLGCPIGNLAAELSDSSERARREVAALFQLWTSKIEELLEEARGRLPADLEPGELACFVLTVMEGGVMQARALRNLQPFDDSVAQLRRYLDLITTD